MSVGEEGLRVRGVIRPGGCVVCPCLICICVCVCVCVCVCHANGHA